MTNAVGRATRHERRSARERDEACGPKRQAIVFEGKAISYGALERCAAALADSGDVGRMDEEGYAYIVDRVKDMIEVSGFKVWPAELKTYPWRLPAIKEVAVYGVPDQAGVARAGEGARRALTADCRLLRRITCTRWCASALGSRFPPRYHILVQFSAPRRLSRSRD